MGEKAVIVDGKEFVPLDQAARQLAESSMKEKDWAGIPVPVPGLSLVLEPRYRHQALSTFRWSECFDEQGNRHSIEPEPPPKPSEWRTVNTWWSHKYQAKVCVLQNDKGQAQGRFAIENRLSFTLRTLEAAVVWPIEAEKKALNKLAELIPEDQFEIYQLTGHFAEVSKRSQVTYLFRRGRPTIALRDTDESAYWLCALCLHPIGYYGDTWAGVMCPTDEVIAHLLMMRGSEEKFWANANQHPLDHPAAGV